MTPDRASVARFAGDAAAAFGRPFAADDHVVVAVSGGPDSMALLLLAHAAWPGRVSAATFDHQLRRDSADEARMVGEACGRLGIMHVTLMPADPLPGIGIQAAARTARYAALHAEAAAREAVALMTAHHADDQAETFLMRANRGAGLAGLSGIRRRVDGAVATVRPLLGWRRAELRALVLAADVPFVDDPSNADERFERARMRGFLTPQTTLDPAALAQAARHLGEVEADVRALADWLWRDRAATVDDDIVVDVALLPRLIRRMLVQRAIATIRRGTGLSADPVADSRVETLLDVLTAGGAATCAGVLGRAKGDIWRFRPAPPRRSH